MILVAFAAAFIHCVDGCVKGTLVKLHALYIAPLRETTPQKRSGIARILKESHSFTCTPTRSSTIGIIAIPGPVWRFSVAVTRWSRSTQLLYIEPG